MDDPHAVGIVFGSVTESYRLFAVSTLLVPSCMCSLDAAAGALYGFQKGSNLRPFLNAPTLLRENREQTRMALQQNS